MENVKEDKAKRPRQRKIRSLKRNNTGKRRERRNNFKNYLIFVSSICMLIISLILYQLNYGSCEFWKSYERNYNKFVYGDEFHCHRLIDSALIKEKMTEKIAAQNDSKELIKGSLALANNDGYIQVIFHGPTGSGKTLASQIITQNFPNKWNVQKNLWNFDPFEVYEKSISRLSKCGFNLIIVDDLEVIEESVEFIKTFENKVHEAATRQNFKVILLAIFKDRIPEQVTESLKKFVLIEFQPITLESFMECIEIHQKLLNVKLSSQEIEELKEIDYLSSGCKLLSKKITTSKL